MMKWAGLRAGAAGRRSVDGSPTKYAAATRKKSATIQRRSRRLGARPAEAAPVESEPWGFPTSTAESLPLPLSFLPVLATPRLGQGEVSPSLLDQAALRTQLGEQLRVRALRPSQRPHHLLGQVVPCAQLLEQRRPRALRLGQRTRRLRSPPCLLPPRPALWLRRLATRNKARVLLASSGSSWRHNSSLAWLACCRGCPAMSSTTFWTAKLAIVGMSSATSLGTATLAVCAPTTPRRRLADVTMAAAICLDTPLSAEARTTAKGGDASASNCTNSFVMLTAAMRGATAE